MHKNETVINGIKPDQRMIYFTRTEIICQECEGRGILCVLWLVALMDVPSAEGTSIG